MSEIASIVYKPAGMEEPENRYLRVPLTEAILVIGHGIEGDRKGSHPDRQLNIMSHEALMELKAQGFAVEPGMMGEQIILKQVDVDSLTEGARLQLGNEAVVEIIKPRTGCDVFEAHQGHKREEAAGQMGMIARVVAGGKIRVGDSVKVIQQA